MNMRKNIVFMIGIMAVTTANASWYWPFGSDEAEPPRISELVKPASDLIDEAADLADEGKISEAVEKYNMALRELERIEVENPERAQKVEFQTVYNKRAYINSAIDSILFKQARDNAKAVAVTDTRELQKKYEDEKAKAKLTDEERMKLAQKEIEKKEELETVNETAKIAVEDVKSVETEEKPVVEEEVSQVKHANEGGKKSRLRMIAEDIRKKDYAAAELAIAGILAEKPNDAAALNLRAAMEMEMGDAKKAERTLDQSIQSNPRSYYAYYNMARLILKTRGGEGVDVARRYYNTGRNYGGPVDKRLEARFADPHAESVE